MNSEPALFSGFSLSSYQLFTASVGVEKQKVLFAPLKLNQRYVDVLSELLINLAYDADKKRTTIGTGIGYNGMAPYGRRGNRIFRDIAAKIPLPPPQPTRKDGEPDAEWAARLQKYEDERREVLQKQRTAVGDFNEGLMRNAFALSVGTNVELFNTLGGTDLDVDNDDLTDNEYSRAAHDVSVTATYNVSSALGFVGVLRTVRRRATAEEEQRLIPYRGMTLSTAWRTPWVFNREYRTSEDWLKTGFVPALYVGASYEQLTCREGDVTKCADSVGRRRVVTPFLDFRLSPTSQFRVGLPLQRDRRVLANNGTQITPVFQYSLQLSTIPK